MSKLFISYRRDDTADICGRLDDKLAARFGRANVFKDVDSIPLGSDFREILRDAVGQCAAMLVVIGLRWTNATDTQGRRRLDNPNDFVRIEVEAALARRIPVIPVLVQGATIPRVDELAPSLTPLAYRQGADVRGDPHFHRDVDQLMDRLALLLQSTQPVTITALDAAKPPVPSERFPQRLASLGFARRKARNVEFIVPPVVPVPAGDFLMGSDPRQDRNAYDDEQPQHRLALPFFSIARFPVTVAEYACIVCEGQNQPYGWQQQLEKLDHPVVYVSWLDAVAYASWIAKLTGQPWRLPSEAEWEKAARWDPATHVSRIYPWGDTFNEAHCNTREGGKGGTTPVGTYSSGASPCDAEDMAGNVWEWMRNAKKPYPYDTLEESRWLDSSDETRILRGGSWYSDAGNARAAYRVGQALLAGADGFGFRLVLAASDDG